MIVWLRIRRETLSWRDGYFTYYEIMIGNTPVGRCEIERRAMYNDPIWMLHIQVKPEYQRQGIGTKVHDYAEILMREEPGRLVPAQHLSNMAYSFWLKRSPSLMKERNDNECWRKSIPRRLKNVG